MLQELHSRWPSLVISLRLCFFFLPASLEWAFSFSSHPQGQNCRSLPSHADDGRALGILRHQRKGRPARIRERKKKRVQFGPPNLLCMGSSLTCVRLLDGEGGKKNCSQLIIIPSFPFPAMHGCIAPLKQSLGAPAKRAHPGYRWVACEDWYWRSLMSD